jgi:hypothetical protein
MRKLAYIFALQVAINNNIPKSKTIQISSTNPNTKNSDRNGPFLSNCGISCGGFPPANVGNE